MTGKTISELLELTSVSDNDQIIIRDVSETGPTKTRYVRASILGNYYTAYLSTVSSQAIAAAQQAAAAAQLAAQTITTVTNAATAAGNSATAAANSVTSASTSASTATTQATNAGNSATAASNSATAAGTSATNANNSAGAAAGSASAAAGSASAAGTSATNASNSATSAAGSATTAGTAATNAGNSATAAAGSASAASTSASNASTSASNAATSETNSAASATALTGTSTTSLTIGTGSKVFTTQSGKSFNVGTYIMAVSNANSANWMFGQVTAYSGTSLTVNVTSVGGSGTLADWNLYGRAGPQGVPAAGTGDFVGPASSTTDYIVTFGDGTGKLGKNSGKIIPAGAVVGTTDTQTLTNKTLGFGTGSSQAIAATSANTGFLNDFRVANSGTGSTSGTAIRYTLDLSAVSNGYGLFQLTGGATPTATLQSGSGITGGLTISALAGPLAFQNGGGTQSLPTATDTLVGRATTDTLTNKSIDAGQLTGTIAAGRMPAHTGDVTSAAGSVALTVANDAVTYAKMQNVSATSRVLGRKTAGAGDPEELALSDILDFIGSAAQGDILYRGASAWARLPAGTSGQVLTTGGAGANPAWAAAGGGGDLTLIGTTNIASSVSSVTISLPTGYKSFKLVLRDLAGAAALIPLSKVSPDGGTTIRTGGYKNIFSYAQNTALGSSTIGAGIYLLNGGSVNDPMEAISGEFLITSARNAAKKTQISGVAGGVNSTVYTTSTIFGMYNTAEDNNAIVISFTNSNATSGDIDLYGLK